MKYLTILSILLFAACYSHTAPSKEDLKETAFRNYFKKFNLVSLPLRICPDVDLDYRHDGQYPDIISAPADTIFLDTTFRILDQFHLVKCYGYLPDTDDCVHLIWLSPVASSYALSLMTFTKTGEELSTVWLGVRGCGVDPCFHCTSTITIAKDYTVYAADTDVYEPCDEQYHPIPGKPDITVIYKTGIIPHNGKPVFTEVKEKKLP